MNRVPLVSYLWSIITITLSIVGYGGDGDSNLSWSTLVKYFKIVEDENN